MYSLDKKELFLAVYFVMFLLVATVFGQGVENKPKAYNLICSTYSDGYFIIRSVNFGGKVNDIYKLKWPAKMVLPKIRRFSEDYILVQPGSTQNLPFLIDLSGKKVSNKWLPRTSDFVFSPDKNKIAFIDFAPTSEKYSDCVRVRTVLKIRDMKSKKELIVAGPKLLTPVGWSDDTWASDSKGFYAVEGRKLYFVDAETGTVRATKAKFDGGYIVVCAERNIAFDSLFREIPNWKLTGVNIIDLKNGEKRVFIKDSTWIGLFPKGDKLIYNINSQIWIIDIDGKNQRKIVNGNFLFWVPDRSNFIYSRLSEKNKTEKLYVYNLKTGNSKEFFSYPSSEQVVFADWD
jgi:hypothetical protein